MTAIPQPRHQLLSDRVANPLREVAHRHWFVRAAVGVLQTLIAGLGVLLLASLLLGSFDRLWAPVRMMVAACAWGGILASAVYFLRPAFRRWTLSRAALHVEQQRPDFLERLSSAVELTGERDPHFRGSPALIDHLLHQAETDASALKPDQIIRTDRIVRWALGLVPVLLAWLVISLIPVTSRTAMGGLYRVLMPWKQALPAALSRIVVKPGDVTLTQGDALDITARVASDAATLVRRFDNGQTLTDEMDRAAANDFRFHLDNLQQGFQYRVSTGDADSPWYQAIVHPRPQVVSIDLRYDYPAYTALPPRTDAATDGSIEALVNTRVTLTIHAAAPVVLGKSKLVLDEGRPEELDLPLKAVAGTKSDYEVTLLVQHSGEYRVRLLNEFDLSNRDEPARGIVATPDEVPSVVIESPESQVTVRPDDLVPVKYTAGDDFGVARLEAIVQIDDKDPQTIPIYFKTLDRRNVTGPDWRMSVADLLARQNVADADHITYQLKVTDNRDPDPQHSFSARQTLKINKNEWQSFQAKLDQKVAQDLTQAIQKAIGDLDRNRPRMELTRNQDAHRPMEEYARNELHKATAELPKSSRDLSGAADDAMDTVFEDVARKVKAIADNPLRAAGDDAAQAQLSADDGEQRKELAAQSVKEIQQARDALQKLLEKQEVQQTQRAAEAARDLAEAARKQEEAARKMQSPQKLAHNPDAQARQAQQDAMQKQQQAIQKLRHALDQSEPLRNQKASETARKLQDLIRKVEDLQKQQSAANEQSQKHDAAEQVQENANALAQQQEELNKEIRRFAQEHKDSIEQATAQPPANDHQDNIVKELNKNRLDAAHDQMNQSVGQLRNEAQRLADLAHAKQLKGGDKQREALAKEQQKLDKANQQKDQAAQAADALKQQAAQVDAPKADDEQIKKAQDLAKSIERQAGDSGSDAADAQADARAAEQAAGAAAQADNADDAKQELQKASDALRKAGSELAEAAKKNMEAHQADQLAQQKQQAQAAAEQAKEQTRKQQQLAKALEGERKQLAGIQRNRPPLEQTAQQQDQVAEQTKAALQQAHQLEDQAQGAKDPDVAHRAKEAQSDLAEAQEHTAAAARAAHDATDAQHRAANSASARDAQAGEQKADAALKQADQEQRQAREALAKAEGNLREVQGPMAQADAREQGQEQGEEHGDDQGTPHQNGNESGQGHHHHSGTPKQLMQRAAQAAQEAARAQEEAQQQNTAAAQQAARALDHAAQAMADAVPGSVEQGQPADEQAQGDAQGEEPGQDAQAQDSSANPGQTSDSHQGISLSAADLSNLPASVRDIGISADQWAKLPPLEKKDLLNAAQQSGPPAYRQMIKDYFLRVAKMQDSRPSPGR